MSIPPIARILVVSPGGPDYEPKSIPPLDPRWGPLDLGLGGFGRSGVSPEDVAKRAFELVKLGRADDVIGISSPAGLARFRNLMQGFIRDAVADGRTGDMERMFGRQSSELDRLDDAGFFRAYWEALMAEAGEIREALENAEILISGRVMEGTDTAHVLYRIASGNGWVVPTSRRA